MISISETRELVAEPQKSKRVMNATYGLMAEFETHEQLVRAAEKAYEHGFRKMDGYAPFPVEGLAEALGKKTQLPLIVLIAGIIGGRERLLHAMGRQCGELSHQYWRPAAS